MSIDVPGLIEAYGLLAVFVGAFLEGETILALAGLAAARGYMSLPEVVLVAMFAGFAGDQLYFFMGRRRGSMILARFPDAQERAHRFDAMLARWHAPLIVAIRFMYGFRVVGPILLGMGRVPAWKFLVFNFIGAAIWAPLIAGLGYAFGYVIEDLIDNVDRYEKWIFLAILALGALGVGLHRLRARRAPPRKEPSL